MRARPLVLLACLAVLPGCLSADFLEGLRGGDRPAWPAPDAPVADPDVPAEWEALLAATDPVLAAVPWDDVVAATDPMAFGGAFRDFGNASLRRFAVAASVAHAESDAQPSPQHPFGHPAYNRAGARVAVEFPGHAGTPLSGVVYLPRNGTAPSESGPYPAVVALEGVQSNWQMYQALHLALADAGYVVLAFDFTGQGGSGGSGTGTWEARVGDAKAAVTWLLAESPVAAFVDAERVGVMGHSMGAITALGLQESDERVRAVVANSPVWREAAAFTRARVPIMLQTGDWDGPIGPTGPLNALAVRQVYEALEGDRALIVAEAATHGQHTNYPMTPTPTWSLPVAIHYMVAWFDHHLQGDPAALAVLTNATDHLSPHYASEYRIGGASGRLAGAFPPAAPASLAAVSGARVTADGAWRVAYALAPDARGLPALDVAAEPLVPRAERVVMRLAVDDVGALRWSLLAGGESRSVALAPAWPGIP